MQEEKQENEIDRYRARFTPEMRKLMNEEWAISPTAEDDMRAWAKEQALKFNTASQKRVPTSDRSFKGLVKTVFKSVFGLK